MVFAVETTRRTYQFVEVLETRFGFFARLLAIVLDQPAAPESHGQPGHSAKDRTRILDRAHSISMMKILYRVRGAAR